MRAFRNSHSLPPLPTGKGGALLVCVTCLLSVSSSWCFAASASARHLPKSPQPPQAADVYQRSLLADDKYSYRGRSVRTDWRTGRAVAVIISHVAPELRRIDYIAPDVVRGRSIVTDARQQWRFDPTRKELHHRVLAADTDAAADADTGYNLLRANYILTIAPEVSIQANRKVNVVSITRKSNGMQARKFWIDAATGLVLKLETYREDGKLSSTEAFSEISFHPHLSRSVFDLAALAKRDGIRRIEDKASGETALPLSAVSAQLGGAARAPHALSGYRLISAALSKSAGKPTLHLRYSDGLNMVSLFQQRRLQRTQPTRVPASMRLTHLGARPAHLVRHASLVTLNWDTNVLNLTMMGEVAQSTLLNLATDADHAIGP